MPRTNLRDSIRPEYLAPDTRAKIVARNTFRFVDREGATVTRLHHTNVVRALPKGRYELNSGGWRTPTTKDRINSALRGYHVYSKNGSWYVREGSWGYEGGVPFYDGMIVPDAFNKASAKKKGGAAEKREQKLRLQVRNFVNKLDKLECLPEPSPGDCWLCMTQRPQLAGGSYKMDKDRPAANADHILSHVKEGYLHGTLILNALTWAGYREPRFIWSMDNANMARGKKPSSVKRALKRYLYRMLSLAA